MTDWFSETQPVRGPHSDISSRALSAAAFADGARGHWSENNASLDPLRQFGFVLPECPYELQTDLDARSADSERLVKRCLGMSCTLGSFCQNTLISCITELLLLTAFSSA
jgi:hypothetical protein